MQSEQVSSMRGAQFPMMCSRVKLAHSIAAATESCAATSNYDGTFRILLHIDPLIYETNNQLNAAAVMRHGVKT